MFINIPMKYDTDARAHVITMPDGTGYTLKTSDLFGEIFNFLFCRPESPYASFDSCDITVSSVYDNRANLVTNLVEAKRMGNKFKGSPQPAKAAPRNDLEALLPAGQPGRA